MKAGKEEGGSTTCTMLQNCSLVAGLVLDFTEGTYSRFTVQAFGFIPTPCATGMCLLVPSPPKYISNLSLPSLPCLKAMLCYQWSCKLHTILRNSSRAISPCATRITSFTTFSFFCRSTAHTWTHTNTNMYILPHHTINTLPCQQLGLSVLIFTIVCYSYRPREASELC